MASGPARAATVATSPLVHPEHEGAGKTGKLGVTRSIKKASNTPVPRMKDIVCAVLCALAGDQGVLSKAASANLTS